MKTTLAFVVLAVFLGSLIGCSGNSAGDNVAPDAAPKESVAPDGKRSGGGAAPELPPPPLN